MSRAPSWHHQVVTPALLRHARNIYGAAMRQALGKAGFHDIPKNGLYLIGGMARHEHDVPLGDLVRELRVTKQAASQLVDALVAGGYLQRAADENDRRKLVVTLTRRGRAAAEVQAKAREQVDAELLARVGARAVSTTRRTLAALIDLGQPGENGHRQG
ncbi:MAG: MarR family winged helix-turn-helix transcriptional regulator [Rhodanobacter sp.]|jgi:DNA-binding MarR family transcriptional regulator